MKKDSNIEDDRLDFEKNEFSELIGDIHEIKSLEVSENFDEKFYQELAKVRPELPFSTKLKSVFALTKIKEEFFPNLLLYRISAGVSLSLAAIILILFFIYNPTTQISDSSKQIASNIKQSSNSTPPKTIVQSQKDATKQDSAIKSRRFSKPAENKEKTTFSESVEPSKSEEMLLADASGGEFSEVSFNDVLKNSEGSNTRGVGNEIEEYIPENYVSSDKYTGKLKDGNLDGKGILIKKYGDKYEGEFKNSLYNGVGTYTWTDGSKYTGDWKDGKLSGKGVLYYENGNKFTGEWLNNKKNGKGEFILNDGTKFVGIWENDELKGLGKLYKANGDTYAGDWKNGMADGIGTYKWAKGITYTGSWKDGAMEGKGTLTSKDGKKYQGVWKNNKLVH